MILGADKRFQMNGQPDNTRHFEGSTLQTD